ncbi:hypothetical protein FHS42_004543 [Streptomyces zagrosensis]|uniref:Uncharacterized protein n=1 Tax=Streptomyces zagrosensis TaxID=1042984 RepID=A0A7W9QCM8_9ACTN|nr:hypothetical protein [Streptomyces zagrosensis]
MCAYCVPASSAVIVSPQVRGFLDSLFQKLGPRRRERRPQGADSLVSRGNRWEPQ